MTWTRQVAAADAPIYFTDPTDAVTRGNVAKWIQALSPGGDVTVVLDGGTEQILTIAAGAVVGGDFMGIELSDCDVLVGNGEQPEANAASYDAISDSLTSASGHIDLLPTHFALLTGAPLALFSSGASAVPGLALVDSKALAVRWNNNATLDGIVGSFSVPPDWDITAAATTYVHAGKVGATVGDLPTFAIGLYNQVVGALHDADTNYGGDTGAMTNAASKTVQSVSVAILAADLAASPASVTVTVKPTDGTLGTDDLLLFKVRIVYTRKLVS